MAAVSSAAAQLRPSLWEGSQNPFLPSPMDSEETLRHSRHVKPLPDPGPSSPSASLRASTSDEFGSRSRPSLRARRSKDSFKKSSNRASFIELDEGFKLSSSSSFIGSLKGKLNKKRSAPLLSSSLSAPPLYMSDHSTTPTSDSPFDISPSWVHVSPRDSYFSLSAKPSKSFREQRKRTAIPEEIIDGVGRGIRFPPDRRSTTAYEDTDVGTEVDVSKDKFRALPLRRQNETTVHPYAPTEAPYAQSFNRVDLQSDFYFDTLIKRLNPKNAPTFHDYKVPPQEVLDLGCGEGTWVRDAAAAWADAGTRVVGFDLVDLMNKDAAAPSNVSFVLGNYVAYSLPFKSNRFNLVRLSNLSASIPENRWEHLLTEVHRVLKRHGRVEIIDDELMFPYPDQPDKSSSIPMTPISQRFFKRASWAGSVSSSRSDAESEEPKQPTEPTSSFLDFDDECVIKPVPVPSLCDDDSGSSNESLSSPEGSNDAVTLAESETTTMVDDLSQPTQMLSQTVENIYESMLENVYRISTRPADFLEDLLWKIFGEAGRTKQIRDFQLSLLSKPMHDIVVESKHVGANAQGHESPKRAKLQKADREFSKRHDNDRALMDKLAIAKTSGKALRLLGEDTPMPVGSFNPLNTQLSDTSDTSMDTLISKTNLQRKRASTLMSFPSSTRPSSASSTSTQCKNSRYNPTGLFLYPDRFLETTPSELDHYIFKHTDALLSSKAALDEHVLKLADEKNRPLLTEKEWADVLWEYERTRREHFGLSESGARFEDYDEDEDEDALREPGRGAKKLKPFVTAAIMDEKSPSSTVVRHIRVFEAFKTSMQ